MTVLVFMLIMVIATAPRDVRAGPSVVAPRWFIILTVKHFRDFLKSLKRGGGFKLATHRKSLENLLAGSFSYHGDSEVARPAGLNKLCEHYIDTKVIYGECPPLCPLT